MSYVVTFEGESLGAEDDKSIDFSTKINTFNLPDEFMEKMFEHLEEGYPYQVLYQIKTITKNEKPVNPEPYFVVVGKYKDGQKGGCLVLDSTDNLKIIGQWNIDNLKEFADDVFNSPEKFALVVVTIAESMAPKKNKLK